MQFIQLDLFSKTLALVRRKLRGSGGISAPSKARAASRVIDDSKLREIWTGLRQEYFPDRPDLDSYRICWSKRRQLRTLASCNISHKKVNVARELDNPDCEPWLTPLLHHEMCHAALADQIHASRGAIKYHGQEFKRLERCHPLHKALDKWIRSGGWLHAIRSHRAKEVQQKRKLEKKAA